MDYSPEDFGITAEMIQAGAETLLEFKEPQHVSAIAIAIYVAMETVRQLQDVKIPNSVH